MTNFNQYLSLILAILTVTITSLYFINKIRQLVTSYNFKFNWNDNFVSALCDILFYSGLALVADGYIFIQKIETFSVDISLILIVLLTLLFHVWTVCICKYEIDLYIDGALYNLQYKTIKI